MSLPEELQQQRMEHKLFLVAKEIGYDREALAFVFLGIQEAITKPGVHITGKELCLALKKVGIEQFGFLAKTVFNSWGVHTTLDWGKIVFALVDAKMMGKQEDDHIEEFEDVFDLDTLETEFKFTGACYGRRDPRNE
jgi:uncharacterized repeat protein (TIGR04138 family)